MDEERLRIAKLNFDKYLEDSYLRKEKLNIDILNRLEQNAIESLVSSKELFDKKISFLWTVVTSYYSMFYIASAYVYKRGYKAQHKIVHKVINEALIVLSKNELETSLLEDYEEEKEKALSIAENLLDSFEYERSKRASFQYEMTSDLKESKAKTSLKRAQNFLQIFRKLINQK
jgi:uncharacterized protein (UPF0332 family)